MPFSVREVPLRGLSVLVDIFDSEAKRSYIVPKLFDKTHPIGPRVMVGLKGRLRSLSVYSWSGSSEKTKHTVLSRSNRQGNQAPRAGVGARISFWAGGMFSVTCKNCAPVSFLMD